MYGNPEICAAGGCLYWCGSFGGGCSVLCAELQQVGSQETADMEDAFETTAQQTIPGYHNVIELNYALFQMALGKNVIEDAADDKVVRLKNGMLTFVCDPADVTDSINGILNLKKVCDENDTQFALHSSAAKNQQV